MINISTVKRTSLPTVDISIKPHLQSPLCAAFLLLLEYIYGMRSHGNISSWLTGRKCAGTQTDQKAVQADAIWIILEVRNVKSSGGEVELIVQASAFSSHLQLAETGAFRLARAEVSSCHWRLSRSASMSDMFAAAHSLSGGGCQHFIACRYSGLESSA